MKRHLLIISISILAISCTQNPKQEDREEVATTTDSLAQKEQTEIATTEIDFVKSTPDKTKILLENEFVRVIEYTLQPGEKDSTHTHPPKTSYVISGGLLRIYPKNGNPFDLEEITGKAEWSDQLGEHYVENIGKTTIRILLTEVKSAREE